ncbi:MAG: cadmium-translocating P-type ATPase [Clostridia bacterium]|nr:cadmium-translocating P-type ATPase [Clostridia bacterium]
MWTLWVGGLLFVLGLFKLPFSSLIPFGLSYALLSYPVWKSLLPEFGWRLLTNENFLMAIASVCAWLVGDVAEGVAVMLFFRVGEAFEDAAVESAYKSIDSLQRLRVETAHLVRNGVETTVLVEQVRVGDEIVIRAGESVPVDATPLHEEAVLDTAALTGESLPRTIRPGQEILSGSINAGGVIHAKVLRPVQDSAISRIIELTMKAQNDQAPTETKVRAFAKVYTPIVVVLAVLVAVLPPLFNAGSFPFWIHKALSFLVVSCPCALVISIPMAYYAGLGMAARRGLLVRGGRYLDTLAASTVIAMDKTGTLTDGTFRVTHCAPVQGITEEELLQLCAAAEQESNHPIAQSILERYGKTPPMAEKAEEHPGRGITAVVDGKVIGVDSARLMEMLGVAVEETAQQGSVVHACADGVYLGAVVISDSIRPEALSTVQAFRNAGLKTVMLTGDAAEPAMAVAEQLGIDKVHHSLLPEDKWKAVNELKGSAPVVFIGDGINDAPVLAAADIGVAMGGMGQDVAIAAADIVLMTDRLSAVCDGRAIGKKTGRIVKQNILFSLGVKLGILCLAVGFTIPIFLAVFADVGVALLCVANSVRLLGMKDFEN